MNGKIFSNLVRHQAHTSYENCEEERTPPVRVTKFSKGKGQNPDFQDITRIQPTIFFLIWFYTLFVSPKNKNKLFILVANDFFKAHQRNLSITCTCSQCHGTAKLFYILAVTIFFILSLMFWPDNLLQALKNTNSSIN